VNVPNSGSPPSRRRPDTGPLRRGRWFHEQVQTAFLADLVGAEATPEYTMTLLMSRRGRVDLLILPQGDERMAVVVEIKSTDWDALAEHRVRPNLLAHIRQLQRYLDPFIDNLGRGLPEGDPFFDTTTPGSAIGTWDSVSGVLLYPKRPTGPVRVQLINTVLEKQALMVVWFDEVDWNRPST
jgi:hypothetical protein